MEGLFRQIDSYCERTDFTYWSEPLNAVTNAAFVIAAIVMWRRVEDPLGRALCAILFFIGVGSYLFHTHATIWAVILDVVPILLFSLLYIYAAYRFFWNWPIWGAVLAALLFIPYSGAVSAGAAQLPFFQVSAGYWGLPLLIALNGVFLLGRHRQTSIGLLIGAAILVTSLTFRSVDELLCDALPMGTHLWWHILNGIMLGWMIEVYRRHRLAAPPLRG